MPKTNTDSTTDTTPWEGYIPYLTGEGQVPDWLSQTPRGLSDAMMQDNMARATGAEGSWNQPLPHNPATGQLDFYGANNVPGAPGSVGPQPRPQQPPGGAPGGAPGGGFDYPGSEPESEFVGFELENSVFNGIGGNWAQGIHDNGNKKARRGLFNIMGGME